MQKPPPWRNRMNEIFQTCQDELKRTTEIGKKMLTASKTNSSLHESYEELGSLVLKELKDGTLNWDNERAKELVNIITNCEKDLDDIEEEVNKIRFAAGPVDVSEAAKKGKEGDKPSEQQPKKQ